MDNFDLIAIQDNVLYKIRAIQTELEAAQKQEITANAVSEITPNLGIMTSGEFRSYADPQDPHAPGDGFSGIRITGVGMDYGGVLYAIVGANNDNMAFGFRLSDGLGVFGGGAATIGPAGINLTGLLTIIRQVATNGANTRTGRLMMTLPDGETVPVWAMDLTSPGGAELLLNPGFETGDYTNWTKTTETNGVWVISSAPPYAGTYSAYFYGTVNGAFTGVLTSDRIGMTALSNYLINGYFKAGMINISGDTTAYSGTYKAEVKWYDHASAGSLLRTDLIGYGNALSGWGMWDKSFNAPVTALSCAIVLTVTGNITATHLEEFNFDSFSVKLASTAQRLWLSDDGVKCTNGMYPKRLSSFADEWLGSGAISKYMTASQPYGYYMYVTTPANGSWMTFGGMLQKGTYTLCVLLATSNNTGKFDVYIDGVLASSANDTYSAGLTFDVTKTITSLSVGYDGYHVIKLLTNGKTGSNYYICPTKAWMYQSAD